MTHRILLADDSVTIRKVMELTFSDEDFAVDAVVDGARALERARASRPDIIVSDVAMPGMDGYEFCRKAKSDPVLRAVPFLFLRGAFEGFDEQKAAACGADGFIVKPFESQEMIARVKGLIAAAAAATPDPAASGAATAIPAPPAARDQTPLPAAAFAPPAAAVSRPADDFGFDFGEALAESFGAPPAAFGAEHSAAAASEPPAELEEDLWSEVSLRDRSADIVGRGAPSAGIPGARVAGDLEEEAEDTPDETLFEEMPAPRHSGPIEPEPEAVRAIVSSLASPSRPPLQPPAAVDPAEIERIVNARVEVVVRQVLESMVKDLARTVIETVSWEVIPDLAEAMIRAEIERITQSTRTG